MSPSASSPTPSSPARSTPPTTGSSPAPGSASAGSAAPGETTSTMGAEAVRRLMAAKGLGPDDVDALIVATVTPDMLFPATACLIQDQLGTAERLGLRPLGRLLRIPLRAHHRRAVRRLGRAPPGDRGRRRPHELDHRPAGPNHGGALRRRRRRGAAGGGGAGIRHPRLPAPGGRERPDRPDDARRRQPASRRAPRPSPRGSTS